MKDHDAPRIATAEPSAGASNASPSNVGPSNANPAALDAALGAALRALPAERAGAGFTARVLARLDRPAAPSRDRAPARSLPLLAALAAAVLAVAVGLTLIPERGPEGRAGAPPRVADAGRVAAPAAGSSAATVPTAPEPGLPAAGGRERPAGLDRHSPEGALPAPGEAAPAGFARTSAGPPSLRAEPAADPRAALDRVRAELDALRREHRRFQVGLGALPEIGADGEPVLYLGGDEGLELVLDLGRDAVPASRGDAGSDPGSTL